MMLNHLGEPRLGEKIKSAYNHVLAEGKSLTRDLGGSASTDEFTDAVISKLK